MSWSISAQGRAHKVRNHVSDEFGKLSRLSAPESDIAATASMAIDKALERYPHGTAVRVEACGSQGGVDSNGCVVNSLSIKIEPLYNFLD